MIPGINPKDMARAMKKLGVKQEELNAKSVVITLENKQLVFENPQVVKINMLGQETYQVTGNIIEKNLQVQVSDEDIETVASQAGVSKETAFEAIKNHKGDLAAAILDLKKNQD